jgi:hypothetical protein
VAEGSTRLVNEVNEEPREERVPATEQSQAMTIQQYQSDGMAIIQSDSVNIALGGNQASFDHSRSFGNTQSSHNLSLTLKERDIEKRISRIESFLRSQE